jgi:hypothetical protein
MDAYKETGTSTLMFSLSPSQAHRSHLHIHSHGSSSQLPSFSLSAGETYEMGWVWDSAALCYYVHRASASAEEDESPSVLCYSSEGPFPQRSSTSHWSRGVILSEFSHSHPEEAVTRG